MPLYPPESPGEDDPAGGYSTSQSSSGTLVEKFTGCPRAVNASIANSQRRGVEVQVHRQTHELGGVRRVVGGTGV